MAVDQYARKTTYTSQHIDNVNFDPQYEISRRLGYVYNPVTDKCEVITDIQNPATKITISGAITYIAISAPGTSQATAKWQVKKIDATDPNNVVTTWAGGGSFNQVATDLTVLSYS